MISERDAYDELCAYTLTHGGAAFIHQHVVDAFAAQHATPASKPIGVTFALVGLYLHVERSYSGRQVQHMHMLLARAKHSWPTFELPTNRGAMTAADVMRAPEGAERDRSVHDWCVSVWDALAMNRDRIIDLLRERLS